MPQEEQFSEDLDPAALQALDRTVSSEEIASFYKRKIVPRLKGVTSNCIRAEVCLYTSTPSEDFVIEAHRESDDVLMVSACSGHGFKHSAAIGEACAEWAVDGSSTLSLAPFRKSR